MQHRPYYKRVLQKEHMHLYQNSSALQISHRVPRNLGKTPSKKNEITRSSLNKLGWESTLRHWLALLANRND